MCDKWIKILTLASPFSEDSQLGDERVDADYTLSRPREREEERGTFVKMGSRSPGRK